MDTARDFTLRLQDLLRRERLALGDFLVQLAEFDEARLWVELGYTSLFYFLHRELGLSKGAAYYRKTAAELVQRFPEVIEPLRDGRLCLTTVVEVANVLTPENQAEVLPRFFGLSKREAQEVAAELRPSEAPPRRDVVTTVPVSVTPALALGLATTPVDPGQELVHLANQPAAIGPEAARAAASAPRQPREAVEALTATERRVHFTVSREFMKKLEAARDALSHSHPDAGMEEILEAGLDLLLERDAKRKGFVKKPLKTPRASSDPNYVPAHVRREVWKRDQGKCQWPMASGGICGSTRRCEIDHIKPRALGGESTVENCRVCCDLHNDRAAREVFGDTLMDQFTTNPRAGAAPTRQPRRARTSEAPLTAPPA